MDDVTKDDTQDQISYARSLKKLWETPPSRRAEIKELNNGFRENVYKEIRDIRIKMEKDTCDECGGKK